MSCQYLLLVFHGSCLACSVSFLVPVSSCLLGGKMRTLDASTPVLNGVPGGRRSGAAVTDNN